MVDPQFYRAFEDRFRGSHELVKSRLGIYLPFIAPFKTLDTAPNALDLGCGRGEWLELLQEHGFQGIGVDSNDAMLTGSNKLKLNTVHSDFLEWLKSVEPESQSVVSAFHFVEHITFEMLFELVKEAHRVLKPGGLLILETQNSENLLVGASTFYIDPTHQRPIHPLQLSFVAEYLGFQRIKTLYLQESPELVAIHQLRLINVITGVSPDYAVVAQKCATKEVTSLFDSCFDQSYGLRLSELAERYDRQDHESQQKLWYECSNLQLQLKEIGLQNCSLQVESQRLQNELRTSEIRSAELAERISSVEIRLLDILSSTSWRLTTPLRKVSQLAKGILRALGRSNSKIDVRKD